jgi:hypothetical protein
LQWQFSDLASAIARKAFGQVRARLGTLPKEVRC